MQQSTPQLTPDPSVIKADITEYSSSKHSASHVLVTAKTQSELLEYLSRIYTNPDSPRILSITFIDNIPEEELTQNP